VVDKADCEKYNVPYVKVYRKSYREEIERGDKNGRVDAGIAQNTQVHRTFCKKYR